MFLGTFRKGTLFGGGTFQRGTFWGKRTFFGTTPDFSRHRDYYRELEGDIIAFKTVEFMCT